MGGDNNIIIKLNLQQLFDGNILDNHIGVFVFIFSKLQANRFRSQMSKISNSLTMPVAFAFHVS